MTNFKIRFILIIIIKYIKLRIKIIGDWGLGIGPNPQSPIPNPHYKIIVLYFIKLF